MGDHSRSQAYAEDAMNFSRVSFLSIRLLVAVATGMEWSTAEAAFFDLLGAQGAAVEGALSNSATVGGITATLTANSGALNQTTNRFGVNAAGSGDDADTLDGGEGADSITLTFSVDIFLEQIQLSVLSAGEAGLITIAGGTPISLLDTGAGMDEFDFNSNNLVLTTESVVLSWVSGNGFSFDDFTVSASLGGDFDGDGDRDGADFLIWQRDLRDADNLADWEANFSALPLSAVTATMPEPASLLLALLACQGWLVGRGRRI